MLHNKRKVVKKMTKVTFKRKALKAEIIPQDDFKILKEVVLTETDFNKFLNNMLDDFDFIDEHKELMYVDENGVYNCIFVTSENADYGILVESEGYSYARYSAYIKKSDLGGSLSAN